MIYKSEEKKGIEVNKAAWTMLREPLPQLLQGVLVGNAMHRVWKCSPTRQRQNEVPMQVLQQVETGLCEVIQPS